MARSAAEEIERIIAESRDLVRKGLDEENEQLLRSAISRFPNDAELCLRTGVAIHGSSPETAKEYIRRALALAPNDSARLTRGADIMFYLGEFDEARDYAKRAARHAPEDFDGAPLVHIAGKLAAQKGNEPLAERLLTAAFENDPALPAHGEVLAAFLAERGRLEEALKVVAKALQSQPTDQPLTKLHARITARLKAEESG